ncbi:MAG: hypothetical protein AAF674_12640 [Pseudomonadota bacterium]
MSSDDFQQRVERHNEKAAQTRPRKTGVRKTSYGRLFVGALLLSAGYQAVKHTNANYESIRDTYGVNASVGLGIAGIVALLVGAVLVLRAVSSRR